MKDLIKLSIINSIKEYFGFESEQWKWVGSVKVTFTDQNKNIVSSSGFVLYEKNDGKFRYCSILNKRLTDEFKNHPFYFNNIIPWLDGYGINCKILDTYSEESKSLIFNNVKKDSTNSNVKADFKLLQFKKPEEIPEETKPAG
jgi:hypothetical protein